MQDKKEIALALDEIQQNDPDSYKEIANLISYAKKLKDLKTRNISMAKEA